MGTLRDGLDKVLGKTELPHDVVDSGDSSPVTKSDVRVTGKIIKVSTEEGWGFISSKEIKFTRIFFHWTSLKQDTLKFQDLKNGLRVEFTPVEVDGKGWRAIKIKVLNDSVEKDLNKDESTGADSAS